MKKLKLRIIQANQNDTNRFLLQYSYQFFLKKPIYISLPFNQNTNIFNLNQAQELARKLTNINLINEYINSITPELIIIQII